MTSTDLITISVDIGCRLLESGAEIYRVEESIERICHAYGIENVNVYAVPTAIIATIETGDKGPVTRVVRIHKRSTNLGKLDQLNSLCRAICVSPMSYIQIQSQLHMIQLQSAYKGWQIAAATGGVGLFFTLLFGGKITEGIFAFLACLVLYRITNIIDTVYSNQVFINIVGAAWIATTGIICYSLHWITAYDTMIIGSIMNLVPGLAITNSIRDLISGDIVAGITKLAEALLIAAGIAVGAALPFSIVSLLGGHL